MWCTLQRIGTQSTEALFIAIQTNIPLVWDQVIREGLVSMVGWWDLEQTLKDAGIKTREEEEEVAQAKGWCQSAFIEKVLLSDYPGELGLGSLKEGAPLQV